MPMAKANPAQSKLNGKTAGAYHYTGISRIPLATGPEIAAPGPRLDASMQLFARGRLAELAKRHHAA